MVVGVRRVCTVAYTVRRRIVFRCRSAVDACIEIDLDCDQTSVDLSRARSNVR